MYVYHKNQDIELILKDKIEIQNFICTEINIENKNNLFALDEAKKYPNLKFFPFYFDEDRKEILRKKFLPFSNFEFSIIKKNFILIHSENGNYFGLTFEDKENEFLVYSIEKLRGNFTTESDLSNFLFFLSDKKDLKFYFVEVKFLRIYSKLFKELIEKKEIYFLNGSKDKTLKDEIKIPSLNEYDNFIYFLNKENLKALKQEYFLKIENEFEENLKSITKNYTNTEKFSFPFKVNEAKNWLGFTKSEKETRIKKENNEFVFLFNEVLEKNIDSLDELANSILEKSNIYSTELAKNIRAKKLCNLLIEKTNAKIELDKINFKDFL